MQNHEAHDSAAPKSTAWNKSKLIGPKPPLRPKHVWAIRTKLQVERRTRGLAMFNLAMAAPVSPTFWLLTSRDRVSKFGVQAPPRGATPPRPIHGPRHIRGREMPHVSLRTVCVGAVAALVPTTKLVTLVYFDAYSR
jgi:hypothetical protein